MLSVHNNLPALNIVRNLGTNARAQSSAMEKLSSGFRINKASDDPSGLLLSEKLQAQIEGLKRAITNTEDADALMGIMEGGLGQVQSILRGMRDLAVKAANSGVTSAEQTAASQAEMDNALLAINQILQTTNMGGRKLLNDVDLFSSNSPAASMQEIDPSTAGQGILSQTELGSDFTVTITGVGENGEGEMTFDFRKGESYESVLKQLRSVDTKANPANSDGEDQETGDGTTPEITPLSATMSASALENLKNMEDDEALSSVKRLFRQAGLSGGGLSVTNLSDLPELGDEFKLSKSDQALVDLSDKLSGLTLGTLGGTQMMTNRYDENGDRVYNTYSLKDLFSGGDASLGRNAALAMQIIEDTSDHVGKIRADIGATIAMREHQRMAMEAELENVTKMDSLVRDTDMAEAMTEFSRATIMNQVGTKLLRDVVDHSKIVLDLFA